MEIKFCNQCGKELILKEIGDEGKIPYCSDCNKPYFNNPICSVLVAVVNNNNEVLEIYECKYINSYYYDKKEILMTGFIAFSKKHNFNLNSKEVDSLKWEPINSAIQLLRDGSISQTHLVNVLNYINR